MGTLQASGEDVRRWRRERRYDILFYAFVMGRPDDPWADLWIDRDTGDEKGRCPFVRKDRDAPTYRCTIYETRPEVCRKYKPWGKHSVCEEVVPVAKIKRAKPRA
jgi:Fe-S-cluster containining protein